MSEQAQDITGVYGDSPLDCNISGMRLKSVVQYETEFVVVLSGGEGELFSPEHGGLVPYGDGDLTLVYGFLDTQDMSKAVKASERHSSMLAVWLDSGRELQFLGAPQRPFLLSASQEDYLVIPRSD